MTALVHPARGDLRLPDVLEALAHPVRLRIVRRLADGEELTCGTTLPDVGKSTASHHWRVLREGGVLFQRREGRTVLMSLRRADLDARFPGLLDAVLNAAASAEPATPGG
ncbi:ArsR/SmtB family transcription factor [Couchioplanes azureus]|uniref:ArsR/SmtB family transcription factor n=1 Tax=Couchioplanes caeruleus TaxID=56438 RepID=UPI0016714102|nr:helix-turn-helix domain-containing protein [Couchioplanes caeruleus]GGQ85667.1 transcriptional regulator [Couchioplanes caeruleus subsp. azureus]